MDTFVVFLNANAGAFNLLFSAVVAIATVVYAWLTARLVSETRRLREVQTEPTIEVTYRAHDEAMALLELVVQNIGSGPAYNITVDFTASPASAAATELVQRLTKIKSFSGGIKVLMPRQEFKTFWTDVRQNHAEKLNTIVTASTTCQGATGVVYQRQHTIDLSELDGVVRLGTPPLFLIARSLAKIETEVGHLTSGFHRLRVDTYTNNDRQSEQELWEAEREAMPAAPEDVTPAAGAAPLT
jgi:hypothetical protein